MAGNITLKYGTNGTYTCSLGSLASDTNLLAGRQSTTIDNTATLADDYLVSGKIKLGTTPTTAKQIEVWAFGDVGDGTTYLDAFTATDANRSVSFSNIKPLEMRNVATWVIDSGATTGSLMYFGPMSLKSLFGYIPKFHGLWVVHNSGTALDATGGNHVLYYLPVFWQYT